MRLPGRTSRTHATKRRLMQPVVTPACFRATISTKRGKVMIGTVRMLAVRPEDHHRLAFHEAGHIAVAYVTPNADPLDRVTIILRGHGLGGRQSMSERERQGSCNAASVATCR